MKPFLRALVLGAAVLTACRTSPEPAPMPAGGGGAVGAASPRAAVDAFLGTVNTGDLQALSLIWGNADGPVRNSGIGREELERRELIIIWCTRNDSHRIVDELPHGERGRAFQVALTRGAKTLTTQMYTVPGPGGRWFVENVDMDPALRDFCRERR